MPRKRKKPNFNQDELSRQLVNAVADVYLNPVKGMADENGHLPLSSLAEEFTMTPIKIRKLLVTAGVYETEISREINELYSSGMSVKDIQKLTGLSAASVNGYLPYHKAIYKMEERSLVAERIQRYRERKAAIRRLKESIEAKELQAVYDCLWEVIRLFERYLFEEYQLDTNKSPKQKYRYKIEQDTVVFSESEVRISKNELQVLVGEMVLRKTELSDNQLLGEKCLQAVLVRIGVLIY